MSSKPKNSCRFGALQSFPELRLLLASLDADCRHVEDEDDEDLGGGVSILNVTHFLLIELAFKSQIASS